MAKIYLCCSLDVCYLTSY